MSLLRRGDKTWEVGSTLPWAALRVGLMKAPGGWRASWGHTE